jgi:hypothetical protein
MNKKPLVSSLSLSFRKAVMPESVEETKQQHRETLHNLIEKYIQDVQAGKAEGIRNAKELVEVMKMDLLLMGEATERTDNTGTIDEVRVNRIAQFIPEDDPAIQNLINQVLMGLNDANDEADVNSSMEQQEIVQQELEKFSNDEDYSDEE